ncbi:hypothetical protein ACQPYK_49040 (plasmid) [Streptosporangium sp. CA-135522]|uniref:hypothetical protein n=1 Tax=Streptosporangium sp. CA-135522 TaxID=3240072 RepID=UPI003D9117D9
MAISLIAAGSAVIVHRDLQPIGRVWWNSTSERWHAETTDGDPIDEHLLRTAAIDLVAEGTQKLQQAMQPADLPVELVADAEEPCSHRPGGDHPSLGDAASGA